MVSDGVEHQAVYDPRLIQGAQEVVSLPLHKHARAILQDALWQVKCGPSSERWGVSKGLWELRISDFWDTDPFRKKTHQKDFALFNLFIQRLNQMILTTFRMNEYDEKRGGSSLSPVGHPSHS